jgi:hypothetical protein
MVFHKTSDASLIVGETSSRSRRDMQRFHNEEISKSVVFDMVCAMRSFENIRE